MSSCSSARWRKRRSKFSKDIHNAKVKGVLEYPTSNECQKDKDEYIVAAFQQGFELCRQLVASFLLECDLGTLKISTITDKMVKRSYKEPDSKEEEEENREDEDIAGGDGNGHQGK
uniref:Uncharacterized protein n=1 Tax=Nelumbo nucifera TaxID=4432 RepID=A0A822Z1W8_NELNU|nr:TPA_asm: hypothetical protein HUJ06_013089 [Nelumbo nucifera]